MIQKEKKNKSINKVVYKIAIQMDCPHELDKKTDSTFALIEEALKRDYKVFIYTVDKLSLIDNIPFATGKNVMSIDVKKEKYINLTKEVKVELKSYDFILIRQDPPFDMNYITATHILEKIGNSSKIINHPVSIRNCPEKLFVTNFFHLMPF